MEKELEEIFVREFGEIKRRLPSQEKRTTDYDKKQRVEAARREYQAEHQKSVNTIQSKQPKQFFLVDGYNVIFAWQELSAIARDSLEGARGRLMDIMCNYQAHIGQELILVFDAYRLQGHPEETVDYHNIHVVYTREAETSDRLEQMIVMGDGARRISARELEQEVRRVNDMAMEAYGNSQ
jgi:predicted RNA-binding protein with PIN domain